jgi:hypothetical protein
MPADLTTGEIRRAAKLVIGHEMRHHGLTKCGDNSCMFGPPDGMGTNGGCRCFDKMHGWPTEARHAMQRAAMVIRSLGNLADPKLLAQLLKAEGKGESDAR